MKHKVVILFFSVLLFTSTTNATANADDLARCEEHVKYGAPSYDPVLLCRLGYALSHDSDLKVPMWVAYHLTREKMLGTHPRSDDFRADPQLNEGERAELEDYDDTSDYVRGHMVPAAVMKWDKQAMSESFLLSNMAPQIHNKFNNGIWSALERRVRKWTEERGELYVVTGPIIASDDYETIGENEVAVPTHFYKVIFDPIRCDVIAFILPHKKLETRDLPQYIKSVDNIENLTGLDFLSELEDDVENLIEAKVRQEVW